MCMIVTYNFTNTILKQMLPHKTACCDHFVARSLNVNVKCSSLTLDLLLVVMAL